MLSRAEELEEKTTRLRKYLGEGQAVRLRGIDWFAWLLCGASSAVLLAAETGVAEALVLPDALYVLTDDIEAARLRDEELPPAIEVKSFPWASPGVREAWVKQRVGALPTTSDRPAVGEVPLPLAAHAIKRKLTAPELHRYAKVGALAAAAMTEALSAAEPTWTEFELAATGAGALLARGLQPALILAAGERRLPLYRHPLPTTAPLERMAILVFCARGYGLYANLTRFVSFGPLPPARADAHSTVRQIEAESLSQCHPGVGLAQLYAVLEQAYRHCGHPRAIVEHHQGGLTGYQAREAIARPDSVELIQRGTVLALNPSLRGAKIEDTFYVADDGLHNLTFDGAWPHVLVDGRARPQVLER